MKVENMTSHNGNDVPNQFIITTDKYRLFQSYSSAIALITFNDGVVHLSDHWDYSPTTSKYRSMFLRETTEETRRKIESGQYKLDLTTDGELK